MCTEMGVAALGIVFIVHVPGWVSSVQHTR